MFWPPSWLPLVQEALMLLISLLCNGSTTTRTSTLGVRLSNKVECNQILKLFSDQWMLVMSTQLIGFSIGGICRRFLVNPPSMSMFVSIYRESQMPEFRNSLACKFGHLRAIQYASRADLRRYRSPWWNESREVLLLLLCDIRHMVPGPRVSVPSTQLLLLGMLDCTEQCHSQRVVWLHAWNGHEPGHL